MPTIDPLSLVTMPPPVTPLDEEDLSFDNYCIVCDRLIVHSKVPDQAEAVKPKKKAAGGAIRIRNPDGTTTTRTANGAKTTRPCLKRNPNSANRLAAVAAGNNAAVKLQPLTRSKTADPTPTHLASTDSRSCCPASPPFVSAIYCSRECAVADAGRSNDAYKEISRTLSYDWSAPVLENIITSGVPVTDKHNPYAPPSPLFISGSDTDSSHAGEGPAGSAPEYFRMSREGPDDAWHNIQRQRRYSAHRPSSLARHASQTSVLQSSDSLSSLWNTESELPLARSTSNGGYLRSVRALSTSSEHSERSAPIPARPIARSNLSQTSLASSPRNGQPIPPEFGSAPNHTLSLLHSYAAAFPVRDPSSTSYTHKGFVFPGSVTPESRRGSLNLARPSSGTIRQSRPKTAEASWDAFGRNEVQAQSARIAARAATRDEASTPKQSLEVENGQWKIKYVDDANSRRNSSKSPPQSIHSVESDRAGGIPIRPRLATSVTSSGHSRTPQPHRMPPPSSIPARSTSAMPRLGSSPLPDFATLRIGSTGCAPYLNTESASVPKAGFNWDDHERKGGKMYELPQGIKIDRSKAGLFYFN